MKTYSSFRPTQFDSHIAIAIDTDDESREDWLVCPVSRTRDSGCLDESNFAAALESLGGEGGDVEVHRFGHWGPGWFEIIIVRPDTEAARIAEEIESALENYPVLDDEDHSRREWEAYTEAWSNYGCREWIRTLADTFKLSYDTKEFLDDCDSDALREYFESCCRNGEYYTPDSDGVSIRTDNGARRATRDSLAAFIRKQRNS